MDIMQTQIILHSAFCNREGTCSQSEFGFNTKLMSIEKNPRKFDADIACSTIISFVICPSSLSGAYCFLQGIDTTESPQFCNCGMMKPYANITLHALASSGRAL